MPPDLYSVYLLLSMFRFLLLSETDCIGLFICNLIVFVLSKKNGCILKFFDIRCMNFGVLFDFSCGNMNKQAELMSLRSMDVGLLRGIWMTQQ